jgi:HlyD family secretion protein
VIFISLPIIKVDGYSSARGILRPEKERINLTTINSGKVIKSNLQINKQVQKGDTLLELDDYLVTNKLEFININIFETEQFLHDINYLLQSKQIVLDSIYSQRYKKEYLAYQEKIWELQTRFQKVRRDYLRNKELFEKGVVAAVEFENYKFKQDLVANSISQLKKTQLNSWQAEYSVKKTQLKELGNNAKLHNQDKNHYIITAPIEGTLLNVVGIDVGSLISAGIRLAEISPNGNLIAECYVSPFDIGLINPHNSIKFQIDAFNYNQWGVATGDIIEIGKDLELINESPTFKIRCKLHQNQLTLKNKLTGKLTKGMTFNARFKLTERTLFELLYDKIDDWLNPSGKSIGSV